MEKNLITIDANELPSLQEIIREYGYYEAGWSRSGNNDQQEMMGYYSGQAVILIQVLGVADSLGGYLETEEGKKAYEEGQKKRYSPDDEDY